MNKIKKIARNIVGILSILIGVLGGFIPLFQGWIFVLLGFILVDFKKKYEIEERILNILSKTKCGKKLATLWDKVKNKNKDLIKNNSEEKISVIYKNINKMEK